MIVISTVQDVTGATVPKPGNNVLITSTGALVSSETPIIFQGPNFLLQVEGSILAAEGTHMGGAGGAGASGNRVIVTEDGAISGFGDQLGGFSIIGTNSSVKNAGDIWGNLYGIKLDATSGAGRSMIINTGDLSSDNNAIYVNGTQDLVIWNSGMISGGVASFNDFGTGGLQRIINTGDMFGHVFLGGGNDYFNSRRGFIEGDIYGGQGDDIIRASAYDDRIHGGIGNDKLFGGAGEDTFYFDTSISGVNNVDMIADFNVGDDMIALTGGLVGLDSDAEITSNFTANKTGKASDSDDHFIYQTTTGKLFYDADGKGGLNGVVMAILDTNLKLTSHNFDII